MKHAEDFYTPPATAAQELVRRRASRAPAAESGLEAYLAPKTCAVLFRQVASPTLELLQFVSVATSLGLSPLVIEFHKDKFVTRNPIKYSLARMSFMNGTGRKGGHRVRALSVVDLPKADGKRLEEVRTRWDQPLVEFHHELLALFPPSARVETLDASEWFATRGASASYYSDFLSLFVTHAVLFESFLHKGLESEFTNTVVTPAFLAVAAQGLRPLICRLDSPQSEGWPYWNAYENLMYEHVGARLNGRAQRCTSGNVCVPVQV